jgi:hypothetical protein
MKIPGIAKALVVVLALFAVGIADVEAQRGRKEEKENPFPNATRKEPATKDLQLSDNKISKTIQKAFDDLNAGEFEKAQKALEPLLSNKKLNKYGEALVYQGLSQVAYENDDVAQSIQYNEKAVALNSLPNDAHFSAIYQLAQLNLMEENYDATLKWMDEWVKLAGKETAEALSIKANALYRLERFEDAAATMKRAIAASDKPQDSWKQIYVASLYE